MNDVDSSSAGEMLDAQSNFTVFQEVDAFNATFFIFRQFQQITCLFFKQFFNALLCVNSLRNGALRTKAYNTCKRSHQNRGRIIIILLLSLGVVIARIRKESSRSKFEIRINYTQIYFSTSRNSLVVRTPRCGRGNPGSNPGYGTFYILFYYQNKRPF